MHGMYYWKVVYRLKFCKLNYFSSTQRVDCLLVNSLVIVTKEINPLKQIFCFLLCPKQYSKYWFCDNGNIKLLLAL